MASTSSRKAVGFVKADSNNLPNIHTGMVLRYMAQKDIFNAPEMRGVREASKEIMAPKYKLTYFKLSALGEPIRFLFAYGNIEFEDYRINREDWPEMKKVMPFGHLPILEFDGNVIYQSSAICRYLASVVNLSGKTSLDAAKADVIVDTISDFRGPLVAYHYDSNPATKEPKLAPLQNETVPYYLSRFDKIVGENGGHFVNGQLTWADLYFVAISDYLQMMAGNMDFFSNYTNLKALKEKIIAIPQIKAWIAKRPTGQLKTCSKEMAPKYKLTYFPVTALGEPIRFLFAYGNIDFEDHRINRDDWPEMKKSMPFGQLPILEFDGNVLTQSGAICRYLARELKLTGKTSLDAAKADIIVDTISDFRVPLAAYHYDSNPATKEPKLAPLQSETVPFYLSRFDKIVGENGGHFVNGQLTWADLYFVAIADYLEMMAGNMDFFSNYPNLKALKEKIVAMPQIKAWIAKRPA